MRQLHTLATMFALFVALAHADLYAPMGEAIGPIVLDGQANGAIVIAAEATAHEQAAASELQAYLQAISGAEVPILAEGEGGEGFPAYVGHTQAATEKGLVGRATALGDEGLLMYADEDGLFLLGGGELGTYNAVHAFLEEKLGVRWFSPDPLGEVVPEMATITIGQMDETQVPDFQMRWIGRGQWALRNRQNVRLPDDALGLKVYASAHTFRKFVPPDEHFDDHPEWFALVGGERKRYEGVHGNQLCTSNPEVLAKVVEEMRAALDADPNLDIISLFPNDGMGFCECDNCKALDEDTMYSVEETNGGWRGLDWESHRTLSRRPRRGERVDEDSPGQSSHVRDIQRVSTGAAGPVTAHARHGPRPTVSWLVPQPCDRGPAVPYQQGVQGRAGGLDGHLPESVPVRVLLQGGGRGPALPEDIPWLRDMGLYGIYTQYKTENVWTIGLNYYVASRLLWDADLDVDALVADYCQKLYGPAAEPMSDYYEAYERAAIASDVHLSAEYADLPKVFTPELIAAQRERVARAAALADTDEVRERVRRAEVVLGYVEVCMQYMEQVMRAATGDGTNRWVVMEEPTGDLQPYADAVLAYISEHEQDNCFGRKINNYIARFTSPANAVSQVSAIIGTDLGPLTKAQWLERTGAQAASGPTPATFDIWLYANDLDGEPDKPEHQLLLRGADGEYGTVAAVPATGRQKDRTNLCYVIEGLEAADYIVDGQVRLRFLNLPEDWYMSTLFAWYVMPHIEGVSDAQATGLMAENLEWVREAAAGFHEYGFNGAKAGESVPVEETIEVLGFGDVTVPEQAG